MTPQEIFYIGVAFGWQEIFYIGVAFGWIVGMVFYWTLLRIGRG